MGYVQKAPWGGTRQAYLNIIECELSESIAGCIFSRDQSTWRPPLHCCIYCYQAALRTVAHFSLLDSEGQHRRASIRARAGTGSGAGARAAVRAREGGWGKGRPRSNGRVKGKGRFKGSCRGKYRGRHMMRAC